MDPALLAGIDAQYVFSPGEWFGILDCVMFCGANYISIYLGVYKVSLTFVSTFSSIFGTVSLTLHCLAADLHESTLATISCWGVGKGVSMMHESSYTRWAFTRIAHWSGANMSLLLWTCMTTSESWVSVFCDPGYCDPGFRDSRSRLSESRVSEWTCLGIAKLGQREGRPILLGGLLLARSYLRLVIPSENGRIINTTYQCAWRSEL